jgi:hypothetical protein
VPPAIRSVQQSVASPRTSWNLSASSCFVPQHQTHRSSLTLPRGKPFVRPYRPRGSPCSSVIGVHGRQSRRYRGGYGQYTPSSARGERQRVNREVPVSVPASVATSGAVGRAPSPPPPPMAVSCSARTTSSTTATARKMAARNYWALTPNTREVNNGEVNTESEMWPFCPTGFHREICDPVTRIYWERAIYSTNVVRAYVLTCSMRFGSQFTACTSVGEACMVREGVRIVQFRCRHSIAWKNHHRYLFDGFSTKPSVSCLLNP